MPKRICVTLDLYEYGQEVPTAHVRTRLSIDCESQSYSGSLIDATLIETIGLSLYYVFNDAEKQCYFALESSSLGYTGDNTLMIPMGGVYNDQTTRREECLAFQWAFPATVNAVDPYLDQAVIRVELDDLIKIPRNCANEGLCVAGRACIEYEDPYGVTTLSRVCLIDGSWTVSFYDSVLGHDVDFEITIENFDPYNGRLCEEIPTLTLTGHLLDELITPVSIEPECPSMSAEWLFYTGQRLSIKKDPRWYLSEFGDCGCICRCICVTLLEDAVFATPPPRMMVGTACMTQLGIAGCGEQYLGGWAVELVNSEDPYDTMWVNFWLEYDCETEQTYVRTSVSDFRASLSCPDFEVAGGMGESISWSVSPGGGAQPYLLQIRCLGCQPCELNQYVVSGCCPYNPVPIRMTAEVTSTRFGGCDNLLGEMGTLLWNGVVFEQAEWTGFLFGNQFILSCGGACGDPWCLIGCGPWVLVSASCDPFELVFEGGGGCAACDEPAMGDFRITITA